MNDSISRQAAIDSMCELMHHWFGDDPKDEIREVKRELCKLPAIEPERLTDDDFETIRIHLNAYKEKLCNQQRWEEADEYQRIIDRFIAFASAQPEQKNERIFFSIRPDVLSEYLRWNILCHPHSRIKERTDENH